MLAHPDNWIFFVHTSCRKFRGLEDTISLQKPCLIAPFSFFYTFFVLLAFSQLFFRISFWPALVCVCVHLAAVSVGRELFYLHFHLLDIKGISVLFQIDAFLLVISHAKFSGGFLSLVGGFLSQPLVCHG